MDSNNKPPNAYNSGEDMWRDNAVSHGIDEAVTICANYLEMNLKRGLSDDEKNFSREYVYRENIYQEHGNQA